MINEPFADRSGMSERSYIEAVSRQIRAARPGANGHAFERSPQDDTPVDPTSPRRLIARRYLLGQRIGRGRLGEIYEGLDQASGELGVDRRVAIQLIDEPIAATPNVADELGRVYGALRAGAHPNVVRILDFGKDRRTFFVAMDLLEGVSLRSVLDSTAPESLSFDEAGPVILAVADALEYLHAKGLTYGEIRPEQVFVTFDYRVQLLDVAPVTALPFSPYFVEDAKAQGVRTPDPRDDVYTLACLTYELLSGRHPFNANSPLEARRARLQPRPLASLAPRRWAAVDRALEFERADRTATLREYLDELGLTGEERLRAVSDAHDESITGAGTDRVTVSVPHAIDRPNRVPSRNTPARAPYAARPARGGLKLSPADQAALFRRLPPPEEAKSRIRAAPIALGLAVVAGLVVLGMLYYPELRGTGNELRAAIEASKRGEPAGAVAPKPTAEIVEADAGAVPSETPVTESSLAATGSRPTAAPVPETTAPSNVAPPPAPSAADGSGAAQRPAASTPVQVSQPAVSGTPLPSSPLVSFSQPVVTVRESQSAASLVIRRSGDTSNGLTVTWWPSDRSAVADADYADVGRRTERFSPGEDTRTILVPLINDNAAERTESFDVYVGRSTGAASNHVDVLSTVRVDIVDDD